MRSNKNKTLGAVLIIGIVCGFFRSPITAQEISKYDLEQRAVHHFENYRFEKAAADFELLHTMFPKDPRYSYYLGRSYLHSNKNLDRAADLLKFAATRNYGEDAYFYLGQVYHAQYKFEDAALTFVTFQKTASESKRNNYDIGYWISVTNNAAQSVLVAQNLRVENLRAIPVNEIGSAFQNELNGKYIHVPEELRSPTDREFGLHAFMFLPDDLKDGDLLFYSSHSNKDKLGEEIYWVQRMNEKEYSIPEPLPNTINTPYDDAYPFFDKINNTLYFSSKGHNTSGGYDVFKSVYDDQKKIWCSPEKLDFPINSVHNDFMFSYNASEAHVVFLTDRNSGPGELEAYTIQYPFTGEYLSTQNYDEILTYAMLSPASITIDDNGVLQSDQRSEKLPATDQMNLIPANNQQITDEYTELINQALAFQSQSDSLELIVKEMRLATQDEHNFLKKQDMVANYTTLDKESKRLQQIANERFSLAEQIRNSGQSGLIAVRPAENPSSDNSGSGITLIRYNTDQEVPPSSDTIQPKTDYNEGMQAARAVIAEVNLAFNILNASPYSEGSPIPFASLPAGLIYKIQLGSYSNTIPENTFGGLTPVSKENADSNTKYYVGEFSSIKKAREALNRVKEYGYPDAFLVSFFNRKKISVQEAREIEFAER